MLSALVAVPSLKMPAVSPTGTTNRLWEWRGYQVRYQALGEEQDGPAVLLVHGLFVNADHWRQNLPALAEAGFRAYSIDLLGYGYSDKPPSTDPAARAASGENGRPLGAPMQQIGSASGEVLQVAVLEADPYCSLVKVAVLVGPYQATTGSCGCVWRLEAAPRTRGQSPSAPYPTETPRLSC